MFNLILALNIFSLLTSVVLSVFAYKKKTNQIAYHFFLLMVIFAFWAICKILQLYAETLFFQVLLGDIIRSVTVFTPLLILNIVIGYSKYPKWFSKRHFNYLLLITGIMALLALISSISRFLAHDYQLIYDMGMSRLKWHSDFWGGDLLVIHRYCCLFVAILILIYCLIESTFVFKKQVLFILIGIALPAITNVLFWFNVSPVPHYPLVTESFAV